MAELRKRLGDTESPADLSGKDLERFEEKLRSGRQV